MYLIYIGLSIKNIRRVVNSVILFVLSILVINGQGFVLNNVLTPKQKQRIETLINPNIDPLGSGWNITQSKIAIGSGGLFGKGPGMSTVKDNLPDAHTDFIFSVIAEEFGIFGCLFIIIFFIYLIFNIYKRIKSQKYLFVILCVSGLVIQLGSQIFINIGSTVGLIPTTGTTLPFISYGGSSMITMALNIGVILALTRVNYKNNIVSNEKEF